MNILKDLLNGFAFGLANIIPGVSGGTFALVLGFYERLIGFLKRIDAASIKKLGVLKLRWLASPFNRDRRKAFFDGLAEGDWPWIMRLATGALACIFLLSTLMDYLLSEHFEFTYAFFFGLILLSIGVPWKLIRKRGAGVIVSLVLGVAVTVGIAAAVNPYDKTKAKSDIYQQRYEAQEAQGAAVVEAGKGSVRFKFTGKYTAGEYAVIFFSGMVAVSAMVLPGISGSLVLILLGQYFAVIRAISGLKSFMLDEVAFLGTFAVGMIIGLLVTARLVEFALRKAHDATMAFLTGLIIGSLYALWPFKEFRVLDLYVKEGGAIELLEQAKIYTNINQLPSELALWGPALAIMIAGAVCMRLLVKYDPDIG